MDYLKETEKILNKLPAIISVEYALLCALDVKNLIKTAEGLKCIDLTEKWLRDQNSVSSDELYAAYAAAAANAAYATAYAADAANAAYTAYAAASAANAANAAYAADAAYAAYAAASAAGKTSKYYYNMLLVFLDKKLTPLECVIFELR